MTANLTPSPEYVRRLEVLRQLDVELTRHLSVSYVLAIGLDAAVRLGNAEAGAIHLVEGEQLRVAQVIGAYPVSLLNSYLPLDGGLVGRVLRQQRAERVLDTQADPDYLPNVPNIHAQITVPLVADERVIGILNIQTSKPERFTTEVFELVQLLAARIAVAIDNARLHEQLKTQLDELQGLYDRVSDLETMKSDMIRIAAHDLRNPLTNILTAVELLRTDYPATLDEQQQMVFDILNQSVTRMRAITTNILSLEKIERSMQTSLQQVVDLAVITTAVYREFERQAREKGQQLELHPAATAVSVRGDLAQLQEVVVNLVSNAIKYTPDGGRVTVSLAVTAEGAVFEVQDTGYGIREEDQSKLFQPFFRARTLETSQIDGTGLGLHLVNRIIIRHRGYMRFSSVYGQGSTFGFVLPLAEDATV
ncbi:MAG TPA: GAF domain-containing sensor histidine kinase [Phototrophicaceae bacterium]|nr:GAF domain-containing sensor histidine kinase [Phototrophicaceae bacterium]